MKTKLLTAMLALLTAGAFASGPKKGAILNYRAQENLNSLYGKVKDLTWSEARNNLVRADFTSGDESISTFFDAQGEVVATTRNISREQLPLRLRLDLDQRFADATILQMFELSNQTEHAYYIELQDKGKRRMMKGYDYGRLSYATNH
jgi:hypothetical protein